MTDQVFTTLLIDYIKQNTDFIVSQHLHRLIGYAFNRKKSEFAYVDTVNKNPIDDVKESSILKCVNDIKFLKVNGIVRKEAITDIMFNSYFRYFNYNSHNLPFTRSLILNEVDTTVSDLEDEIIQYRYSNNLFVEKDVTDLHLSNLFESYSLEDIVVKKIRLNYKNSSKNIKEIFCNKISMYVEDAIDQKLLFYYING